MRSEAKPPRADDPRSAWEPYDPDRDGAWDAARVAHLHRRAGFAATAEQMRRDLADGPDKAIGRILEGQATGPDGRTRDDYEATCRVMADSARRDPSIERVRLLWLFRLLHSPHPLRERMTLAWHGHYATGARKVGDPIAMLDQNDAIRGLWDAPISRLHRAVIDSAAMQNWLDGLQSDREKPNENLGREFLELFALGEGRYTEGDVRAAARALTGYREQRTDDLRTRPVVFDPRRHDDGEKTLLGQTGPWGPPDLVRIACEQDQAARHIARRLYLTLVADVEPPPAPLVDALADRIRLPGDVDVRRGIATILRSKLFHAESTRGRKVKSPVDFAVGLVRASGWYRPSPDAQAIDAALIRGGQTLLDPPGVAGWPGGYSWLGASWLIARVNFVAAIASRPEVGHRLESMARSRGLETPGAWARAIASSWMPGGERLPLPSPADFADAVRVVASLPEAHLA